MKKQGPRRRRPIFNQIILKIEKMKITRYVILVFFMINMIFPSYYILAMMMMSVASVLIYQNRYHEVNQQSNESCRVSRKFEESHEESQNLTARSESSESSVEAQKPTTRSESLEFCFSAKIVKTRLGYFI